MDETPFFYLGHSLFYHFICLPCCFYSSQYQQAFNALHKGFGYAYGTNRHCGIR